MRRTGARDLVIEKIITGGQTGVDRAALDVAIELRLPHGGWCPARRRAEDGRIDDRYQLIELASARYRDRTKKNVADSDGALILNRGKLEDGTALTLRYARTLGKPAFLVDLAAPPPLPELTDWVASCRIKACNVAGPRESKRPGIYAEARAFLEPWLVSLRAVSARPADTQRK